MEVAVKAYRSDTIDAIHDPVRSGCLEFLHYIGVLKSSTSISDKPCITTRRAENTNLVVDDNISAKCHKLCVVLGRRGGSDFQTSNFAQLDGVLSNCAGLSAGRKIHISARTNLRGKQRTPPQTSNHFPATLDVSSPGSGIPNVKCMPCAYFDNPPAC